jgi:ribosomal protein L31E
MSFASYRPRSFFVPFHNRAKRWSVLVCHRRAGKTVAAINDIVARALNTAKIVSANPPQYT